MKNWVSNVKEGTSFFVEPTFQDYSSWFNMLSMGLNFPLNWFCGVNELPMGIGILNDIISICFKVKFPRARRQKVCDANMIFDLTNFKVTAISSPSLKIQVSDPDHPNPISMLEARFLQILQPHHYIMYSACICVYQIQQLIFLHRNLE